MRCRYLSVEFYDEYFSIKPFEQNNESYLLKDQFIRSKMKNGKIYKFVAFTEDKELKKKKLNMLEQKQFWASYYIYFEDKREVVQPYSKCKVQFYTKKREKV